MTEREGLFSVPTRLLLTPEQRARLEALVHARESDLATLLSEIVGEYLDAHGGDIQPVPQPGPDVAGELRKRRAELARMRARRDTPGSVAPTWLLSYIAALEDEIKRLSES